MAPPGGGSLPAAARERVLQNLRVAETLGARTVTLEGRDPAATLLAFAAGHDISRIVVGKTQRSRLQDALFGSFTMEVIRGSRDADVYVISASEVDENGAGVAVKPASGAVVEVPHLRDFAEALGISAASVGLAWLLYAGPDLSTEAMTLMLGVVATAWRHGRWPSLLVALVGALAFNFLFTEPRFTFAIADAAYLLAFAAMAFVGVAVSAVVAATRERAVLAHRREGRSWPCSP